MIPWGWQIAIIALFAIAASASDIASRRIPNRLSLVCAACGLILAYFGGGLPGHALHMAIALALGMLLFGFGLVGGGDAKFYAAMAAFIPLKFALQFALIISLAGIGLLFAFILTRRIGKRQRAAGSDFARLPYGVAIGAGAVATALLAA